jgi:hypothetical protein
MPIDRGALDQQLQEIGEATRWWNQREMRDLPAVLNSTEQIAAIARGRVARVRVLRRTWLIVVTDDRLLCLRSARNKGWRQIEVNGAHISRVSLRIGPFKGRVIVVADGQTYKLLVPRADAYKLNSALMQMGAVGNPSLTGFGPTRAVRNMIDHVLALPAVALGPAATPLPPAPTVDMNAIDQRFNRLEVEVQQLREQVEFLEQLLRERAAF